MSIEVGNRYGRLVVVEVRKRGRILCLCDCGKEKEIRRDNLLHNTRSCGCLKSERLRQKWKAHSEKHALSTGAIYGRLKVVSCDRQQATCDCSCGNRIEVRKYDVLSGKVQSCGCLSREVAADTLRRTATQHGGWGRRVWNLWHNMNRRCYDPSAMGYENYGGSGIQVCPEWRSPGGFSQFLAYVGEPPSSKHTLDRLDNDQGYEPGNVRWATMKEQARNRRNNHNITAFGKTQCLTAWAEEVGLSTSTIRYRLLKGWSAEDALTRRSV